jgi:DNA-binding LacI/PurR family transcriptional regulator
MADTPVPRRRRKIRPTITDVAAAAQVSVATISRFLNMPERVSQALGERIADALRQTGFRRRSPLPASFTHSSAVLSTTIPTTPRLLAVLTLGTLTARMMMDMPVFPWLFSGVKRVTDATRGTLVYAHYDGTGPLPALLADRSVDGLLVLGRLPHMPPALRQALLIRPSVWMMREHSDPACSIDRVFYDNALVGRYAADYLLGQGQGRLAFVNDTPTHSAFAQRRECFLDAVRERGGRAHAYEVGVGAITDLRHALQVALAGAEPLQGIFLPSDNQLFLAAQLLPQLGSTPERSLRLIGCNNDAALLARLSPRPASIDLHLDLIGERAVNQLLDRIAQPASPLMQLFVTPTVVPPHP